MHSMDMHSGAPLAIAADIAQSVTKILTTPIGTRVMRRRFGSVLFDLVDSPGNATGALRLVAAAADAIERWEKRIRLDSASVSVTGDGRAILRAHTTIKADGQPLLIDVPLW